MPPLQAARDQPGMHSWLLRRGLPAFAAALFVWDVVSDGLLARVSSANPLGGGSAGVVEAGLEGGVEGA